MLLETSTKQQRELEQGSLLNKVVIKRHRNCTKTTDGSVVSCRLLYVFTGVSRVGVVYLIHRQLCSKSRPEKICSLSRYKYSSSVYIPMTPFILSASHQNTFHLMSWANVQPTFFNTGFCLLCCPVPDGLAER